MPSHAALAAIEILDLISILLGFLLAVGVAYAAFKGYPRDYSREMYWTAFVVAAVAGMGLLIAAQRTDLGSATRIVLHCICAVFSFLLFGVAAGCCSGIFLYRGRMFSKLSRHDDQ